MTNLVIHKIFIYIIAFFAILMAMLGWQCVFDKNYPESGALVVCSMYFCWCINIHWKRIKNIYQFGE